jgi:carboxylate-amine ligase
MLLESFDNRRVGLEQEFFLVEEDGVVSERADEFLEVCHRLAAAEGFDEGCFASECVLSTVEVCTKPAGSLEELESGYLGNVDLALRAAREAGLRLYPLATYPLQITPTLRAEPHYLAQALVMGSERFRHAGRCAGVHLHLEMPAGAIDPDNGVSPGAPEEGVRELLDAYNLSTALDPAIVALTRSCPFYQGTADGLAARTAHYRGSPDFAPHGLYAALPIAGGLRPYARTAAELTELQRERHQAWISTVEASGLDSSLFEAEGLLKTAWNPVRLNAQDGVRGTLELRGIDSSYPSEIMAIISLITACKDRVMADGLTVVPEPDLYTFEVRGDELRVPDFETLSGPLLREAATRGLDSPEVNAYLDSVFELAGHPPGIQRFRDAEDAEDAEDTGGYRNVEREILARMSTPSASDGTRHGLGRDEGLALVREACDTLESQVEARRAPGKEPVEAVEAGTL